MVSAKVCPNTECPDIELFGVQGRYGDNESLCARCGANLIQEITEPTEQRSPRPEFRKLVRLCTPNTSSELVVIKSLLRAEGIFVFVHNELFGDLYVGLLIPLVNQRTILVAQEDLERALEVVVPQEPFEQAPPYRYGALDRIRILFEALAFGWVIPGRRRRYTE